MQRGKAAIWLCMIQSILLIVSGCALSPLSQRATAFSAAASAATLEVKNGYQVVEQSYYDAQVAGLMINFDKQGFDPSKIQPFMPDKDMKARTQILSGLQQYATLLAEVSGNEAITALDKQSEALGTDLQSLSKDANLTDLTKNTSMDAGVAATAVDALGRILIARKTAKELPSIIESMQKPINQICTLLDEDIGDPEKGGLRNQLKNDYDELIANQRTFIYQNEGKMTAEQKQIEIEKLPQLATAEMQADAALAQTQAALKQLAATHDALAQTKNSKNAPAFRSLLAQLVAQGQQLGAVYSAVEAKK